VIGTDSTCRYTDRDRHARRVGSDLGVGNVVRGTLRRDRERARLSVRLVDTRDERLLWGRSYERPLADLPRLPREVAGEIALQLGTSADGPAGLAGGSSGVGAQAFDLFLRGCLRMRRPAFADIEGGLEDLRRAVELSDDFPQAHAAVARGYFLLASWGRGPGTRLLPEAVSAAERALALDPSLAEARVWSILARAISAWDVERARSELQRLLRVGPHNPAARDGLARCHAALGRVADAIAEQRRALAGDPLSPALGTTLGFFHRLAGEHESALVLLARIRRLHPEWFIAALEAARVHWTRGEGGAASAVLATAEPAWAALLADVGEGRRRQARDALQRWERESSERYVAPYWMAERCMWAGEHDRALDWLERAYEERQVQAMFVAVEPVFAPLRDASRFERLRRRMGLRAS
jgi:tetratricopeptide (TPR) repeat protein